MQRTYSQHLLKTEEWNNLTKFALFKHGKDCYKEALTNGSCLVPHEVLENDFFIVSVYGVDDHNTRVTTDVVKIYLAESGYCTTTEESEIESNPSLVEDIYIKLDNTHYSANIYDVDTVEMDVTFEDESTAIYQVLVKSDESD